MIQMDWQKQVIKLIDNHFKSLGISYIPKLVIIRSTLYRKLNN